ncbi:MAG: DnaJ domain-containing protein [Thermodesulfobacteriota bacterium]
MANHYDTLNLTPQATEGEIKASYRRLAKQFHPDAAGPGGDPDRFRKVYEAYKALIQELDHLSDQVDHKQDKRGREWRFEGVRENGLDVIYHLGLSPAVARNGLKLVLPYKAQEACPRCLGEGHTLAPIFGGPHLRRMPCPKCQGRGILVYDSMMNIELKPEATKQGRVVLKNLGQYQPLQGRRGDLILEIRVDGGGSGLGGLWAS